MIAFPARRDAAMQSPKNAEAAGLTLTARVREEPTFSARLDELVDAYRPHFFELVRIYLGLGLLAKGIQFVADGDFVASMLVKNGQLDAMSAAVAHYIPIAHLAGGLLLAIGLFTRLAALIQLPVLAGAVLFVHLPEGLFTRGQTLEFALLVFFLLALFAVYGGGPLSVDAYYKRRRTA
jgi:putative oxidoreductase